MPKNMKSISIKGAVSKSGGDAEKAVEPIPGGLSDVLHSRLKESRDFLTTRHKSAEDIVSLKRIEEMALMMAKIFCWRTSPFHIRHIFLVSKKCPYSVKIDKNTANSSKNWYKSITIFKI